MKRLETFQRMLDCSQKGVDKERAAWKKQKTTNGALKKAVERIAPLAETSRDLVKQADLLYKLACRLIEPGAARFTSGTGHALRASGRRVFFHRWRNSTTL